MASGQTLTREQMERAIDEGGSVLYQGRILTSKEQLPSEAELAKGDANREEAARRELQAQIARLSAELSLLQPAAPEAAPAPAPASAPAAALESQPAGNPDSGNEPPAGDEPPADGDGTKPPKGKR